MGLFMLGVGYRQIVSPSKSVFRSPDLDPEFAMFLNRRLAGPMFVILGLLAILGSVFAE